MGKDDLPQPEESTISNLTSQELVSRVWKALSSVYDPELGIDIVSLGLIYGIQNDHDTVEIEMTLTTPGCPASENLPSMAKLAAAEAIGGKAEVELRLVWDPPWDPTMINSGTPISLNLRRG